MLKIIALLIVSINVITATTFGGSEEKFIKKYAMMKIYESCFGQEVVKQIRKEMKDACAKCAAVTDNTRYTVPSNQVKPTTNTPPGLDTMTDPDNTLYANQQSFDPQKLHQAILAFRPNGPLPPFKAYPQPSPYYPQVQGGAVPPFYYPQPYSIVTSPYMPFYNPQYLGNQRVSRDMNIKDQLDALTSRLTGRVKNVTCIMQELGYLDETLEPNYPRIMERIAHLPISDELKRDMQDGVVFCQQFSQCVPEVKKDRSPLSRELIKPMFFFKCYKHKKLEACIMKDVREKYTDVGDDDFESELDIKRQGRDMKDVDTMEDLAGSMYDFLYGSDSNLDLDNVL